MHMNYLGAIYKYKLCHWSAHKVQGKECEFTNVPIRYEQSKRHEASIKRSELTLPAALPVAAALNKLSIQVFNGTVK